MDIKRCFEILEINRSASLDEVKQAYRDAVNVWHPDRFSNNPRLRQKAEKRLKEVNTAYEMVKSFLSSKGGVRPEQEDVVQAKGEPGAKGRTGGRYYDSQRHRDTRDKTEAVVEAGTRLFLTACSHLYTTLRRLVASQVSETMSEEDDRVRRGGRGRRRQQSKAGGRGKYRGKCMGRGRGRGR
jgi:curved DNA-binding protein CbpA